MAMWTQEVFGGNPEVHSDLSQLFSNNNLIEPLALVPYVDFTFNFGIVGLRTYRWKTSMAFMKGRYIFEYDAVDGVRAYINDTLMVPDYPTSNSWKTQSQSHYVVDCTLTNDGEFDLRVEYYSSKYSGRVRFYWNIIL